MPSTQRVDRCRRSLSLGVVDAAALALAGDSGSGAELLDTFYGTRALGVFTANTLNVSPEQLLTKRPRSAAATSQAGFGPHGAAAGQRRLPALRPARIRRPWRPRMAAVRRIQVRKSFADTAYWNAAVITDARGNATLTVPLPDNITTWQILGQGITADTLVGAGTATRDRHQGSAAAPAAAPLLHPGRSAPWSAPRSTIPPAPPD